jgi:hypothetical protein
LLVNWSQYSQKNFYFFSIYSWCIEFAIPRPIIYLGHTKSSGSGTFLLYSRLQEIFFLHSAIVEKKLYLSMLFDHTSSNIIIIKQKIRSVSLTYITVLWMLVSIFWITADRNKIVDCGFHHLKEEMKMRRIVYCRFF